jgi:hypothetical protein
VDRAARRNHSLNPMVMSRRSRQCTIAEAQAAPAVVVETV